jgi:hypothetical protein
MQLLSSLQTNVQTNIQTNVQDNTYYKKYMKYKSKYLSKLSDVNMLNFINWFDQNNGTSLLQIKKNATYGRETLSKTDIQKDTNVLEIPPELLITTELFDQFNIKDFVLNNNKLTFLLLYFKKFNKFKEYISILPKSFSSIPLSWDKSQLDIIKNTSIYNKVIEKSTTIDKDYENLLKVMKNILPFTKKEYSWARLCVNSRNFSITKDGKSVNCLAPFADMLNHSSDKNTKWFFDNSINKFVVKATKFIPQNSIVTDTYGTRDAKTYLIWYGFFPKDLHTVNINGLDLSFNRKENINQITKDKITKQLSILQADYDKYSKLTDDKFKQPLDILLYS